MADQNLNLQKTYTSSVRSAPSKHRHSILVIVGFAHNSKLKKYRSASDYFTVPKVDIALPVSLCLQVAILYSVKL